MICQKDILVAIPSKSGQWFRQNLYLYEQERHIASQSLLNQVNGSDSRQNTGTVRRIDVAIPSKSGQWFRRKGGGKTKVNIPVSQSLLNQVNGSDSKLLF